MKEDHRQEGLTGKEKQIKMVDEINAVKCVCMSEHKCVSRYMSICMHACKHVSIHVGIYVHIYVSM